MLGAVDAPVAAVPIDPPVEPVAAAEPVYRRVAVDARLRQIRLQVLERVDELLCFLEVDVPVVVRDVDEQRRLQLVDVVEGRAVDVDAAPLVHGAADAFLGHEVPGVARALVGEPEHEVGHRHHRRRRLERGLVAEHRVQRDEPAVAPADDAEPLEVDVRQVTAHVVDRGKAVVHLVAAVVDGVMVRPAVARAAAVLRGQDDVAPSHRFPDEREVGGTEVAVHAAVDPDQRGVGARSPQP